MPAGRPEAAMAPADPRRLVEFLVRGVVERPEAVSVRASERDRLLVVEVRVAPDEVGKVIGRRGRVVGAIRTLAKAAAAPGRRRVMVEILG
ncbi:MAG: KH domain-containing protein [Armatimonadota bacterium]|nr:KH domain-containing protein [Armatimonadota bacterium]MDR7422078.1 KH domain-containing protein [Armatimonadota bacterium]MDR7454142.1 KH domain-containing protein [Armatimonadota bacterium]MDR7456241.1 KH domain-containing protein [Armatimonadota bacterium]MDR7496891.1 KH domain-containing protein [Armatimonadota bacterium]